MISRQHDIIESFRSDDVASMVDKFVGMVVVVLVLVLVW